MKQEQLPLIEARRDRDAGAALALDHESDWWTVKASRALELLAGRGEPFNADDIRSIVGPPLRPNAMGGLFLGYVKRGLIVRVAERSMQRRSAHARRTPVYVGARK